MSRKKRFIRDLTDSEKEQLQAGKKYGKSDAFRNRCHAILLSSQEHEVTQIAQIFHVNIRTVYNWFNSWEKSGILGIQTTPGQGRKPTISLNNKEHVDIVEKAAKNAAQKGTNMLNEVVEKIAPEKGISRWTLRRFLQKKSMLGKDFVESRKKNHPN